MVVRAHWSTERSHVVARAVLAAERDWTPDFGGEQFCLGRAFYTHFEEGRSAQYFADARASDARVERHAPGLQEALLEAASAFVGARVVRRRGWCGPGVHVFPAREAVARRGGVLHFDTEGLTAAQLAARAPALSFVLALACPPRGGGLRVWDVLHTGHDHPTRAERAAPSARIPYAPGTLVVFDSYRLHQIQGFAGGPRVSATVHAAQLDTGVWEAWF